MRGAAVMAAAAVALGGPAAAAPWKAQAGDYARLGWIGELAGWCWEGGPNTPDAPRDRQCYTRQYDRYLRGAIEIAPAGPGRRAPAYRGDSVFMWDAARNVLVFSYWGSRGNYGGSEGRYDGDLLVFSDPPSLDPAARPSRSVWRRLGPHRFAVSLQRQGSDGYWTEHTRAEYRRAGRAPRSR